VATNTYTEWTHRRYPKRQCNIKLKERETQDDLGIDGGPNFALRIKEEALPLTLQSS
jgi:hypothetical protein